MGRQTVVAAFVVVAALSGLAGSAAAKTAAHTSAARRFLADSGPLDARAATFEKKALSWLGNPTVTHADVAAAVRPLVAELANFKHDLVVQHWPAAARAEVPAVVRATDRLIVDLEALHRADIVKTTSWEGRLLQDQTVMTAASDRMRHALGLPGVTGL